MKRKHTLLIVDDATEYKDTYKRFLKDDPITNWTVLIVSSDKEALKMINSAAVDVILLGYWTAQPDRMTMLLNIKRRISYQAIVICSEIGNELMVADALKAGAHDYLLKENITAHIFKETMNTAVDLAIKKFDIETHRNMMENYVDKLSRDLKGPISNIIGLTQLIEYATEQKDYDALQELNRYLKNSAISTYDRIILEGRASIPG